MSLVSASDALSTPAAASTGSALTEPQSQSPSPAEAKVGAATAPEALVHHATTNIASGRTSADVTTAVAVVASAENATASAPAEVSTDSQAMVSMPTDVSSEPQAKAAQTDKHTIQPPSMQEQLEHKHWKRLTLQRAKRPICT